MTPERPPLTTTPLAATPDDLAAIRCPACQDELALHQPDPDLTHHLLATCDGCDSWFLLDLVAARIVHLPDIRRDRDA